MSQPISKNISASAGTGKTYRLSLEYLSLLLNYYDNPEFSPEQILVITFTRKATAEIRDRIYQHLQVITSRAEKWQETAINLKQLNLSSEQIDLHNPLSEKEINLLNRAYQHLITHKDQLQVMTIDSYIHSIFRNLVRPVRGIDRFELDLKAVEKRMPFLFNQLMQPQIRERIMSLLSRKLKPALDEYQAFFRSLIDNRWLSYLARDRSVITQNGTLAHYTVHPEEWQEQGDKHLSEMLRLMGAVLTALAKHLLLTRNISTCSEARAEGMFSKDFLQLFTPLPAKVSDLPAELAAKLNDDWFLLKLLKLLSGDKFIWSGKKIRASKKLPEVETWKEQSRRAGAELADYLIFRLFLPEQTKILDIWQDVLRGYDSLIFRYKNFTYDDIAWFTFEALFSSEPPLFKAESEMVANEFYDFMSRRTRFMLIDEFQDTSILQFNILKPMIEELISGEGTKPYGGFIVVGDEKQSIFGWRGGQRDLLLNMNQIFPSMAKTTQVTLTDSWRSSPILMDFINGVFRYPDLHDFLQKHAAEWRYRDVAGKKTELDSDTLIRFKLQNCSKSVTGGGLNVVLREFVEQMVIPALQVSPDAKRTVAILARKNNDLELIRTLLAEHQIVSEFQSSKSLLEHPVIKALLFLLRFRVYNDWFDFLAFLRSDLILINGAELKGVIDIISAYQKSLRDSAKNPADGAVSGEATQIDFSSYPVAESAYKLLAELDTNLIHHSCMQILRACDVSQKLTAERDFVNIRRWLDITLQYESTYQSELPRLQGFLRYCEENSTQEIFQQLDSVTGSRDSSPVIQLLTIHKSKGLEFDTVFVWWNLKPFSSREEGKLQNYVDYADPGFQTLRDIALTLHYKKILATSSYRNIMEMDEQREQLEELNNLYVALTRAKSRLYIQAVYAKKEGWDAYLKSNQAEGNLAPRHYAVMGILDYMQANGTPGDDNTWQIGSLEAVKSTVAQESTCPPPSPPLQDSSCPLQVHTTISDQPISAQSAAARLGLMLPGWQHPHADYQEQETGLPDPDFDWKQSFLYDRENLQGSIAHYYLAKIKYATRAEIDTANLLTKRQFGNLVPLSELNPILAKVESLLPSLIAIFDPAYDIVFTEYPIYQKGKEYRIDRLMLNTREMTYRLIDFKTGMIHRPEQLEFYDNAVRKLMPAGYKSHGKPEYIPITLD